MKKVTLRQPALATNTTVFIGIDAHKDSLHVTVLPADRQEEVLWKGTVPHRKSHVEALVARMPDCEIYAAYEAGPTGYKLLRWLQELGCTAFMTPASKVLEEKAGARIKTDGRDSLKLAEQLRNHQLAEVYDLGDKGYAQRDLVRTRGQIRDHRQQLQCQIKSKLLFHGVLIPDDFSSHWSQAFLAWLEQCSDDPYLSICLKTLVQLHRHLSKQIKALDKEIEALAKQERYAEDIELLTSIPGVGTLIAMMFLTELGDISRFERAEHFASFLGLVPGEHSTGNDQNKRGLTRAGNRRVRWALVQASWRLKGKDPRMGKVYERIKFKKNSGVAICAVARRLALAMRGMLRDRTPYQLSH